MLPIDFIGTLHDELRGTRRPEDGLLHCSTDLVGPLRHSQLRLAGAPTHDSELTNDITLMTGTLWHEWIGEMLVRRGIPVVRELDVTPWLPEGWAGTADYLFWDPELQAWVLADLKTAKGESFRYLAKEGGKIEHLWQVSAYWHALASAGFELADRFNIIYLPKNDVKDFKVEPIIAEATPLDIDILRDTMTTRWELTQEYMDSLGGDIRGSNIENEYWTTDKLAPPMERIQSYWWNKDQQCFDVKLVPHWSAQFCPYDNDLCDCNEQGTTKIGHWERYNSNVQYVPRKGYEDIEPLVEPTKQEIAKKYA